MKEKEPIACCRQCCEDLYEGDEAFVVQIDGIKKYWCVQCMQDNRERL